MTNRDQNTSKTLLPGTTARVLLAASALAACYLDFFAYRAQGWADAASLPLLTARLRGTADAPDQYRLGILWLANLLSAHLHIAMTMSLAALDGVCCLVTVLVLFRVLERTEIYSRASILLQWSGAASFVLLINWFLGWLLWLQKPETLPAAMLLALMLWLWQPELNKPSRVLRALGLVVLSLLLASFRADVASLLSLGILLFVCANPAVKLSLSRSTSISVSLVSTLIALAVQIWLMHMAYPQANYGRVKLWQLWPNVKHATRWPPFALFLLPLIWMMVQVVRARFKSDSASIAFLWGAILFAALWVTIGKIDEVRIFLPFALALAPLTTEMAMLQIDENRSSRPLAGE